MIRIAVSLLLSMTLAVSMHAATWTSNGPAGGETRELISAHGNPRLLYVASTGGLFRSIDGGATWRTISGPVTNPTELAIAPSDPEILIAGTASGAMFRSDDGGLTWRRVGEGLPPSIDIGDIAIDPRNPDVVYVGARCGAIFGGAPRGQWHEASGLFKSTDGGATFVVSSTGLVGFQTCVNEVAVDPLNPDTLYATPIYSDSGWARSDDAGATWYTSSSRLPGGGVFVDPSNPNVLYGTGGGALLRSTDGGAIWQLQVPTNLATGGVLSIGNAVSFAIDPAIPRFFFAGPDGAYRSGDRGGSVVPLGGPAREATAGIVFDPASGTLTIGTETGVYQSSGWPWEQWRTVDTGDRRAPTRMVLPSRLDANTIYATSGTRVFVSHDDGLTWELHASTVMDSVAEQQLTVVAIDAADTLYALGDHSRSLFRWTRGSQAWTRVDAPPLYSFAAVFVLEDEPSAVYVADGQLMYRTRDAGATWEPVAPRFPSMPYATAGVPATTARDSGVFYVGGRDPELDFVLYRSVDDGITWTAKPLPPGVSQISVAVDPRNADVVYIASYNGGVYRSRDGGETWTSLTGNLPLEVLDIALSRDGTVLHAATAGGVWELRVAPARMRAIR